MYIIMAPLQIKEGHREEFIKATVEDAQGTLNDQPGCVRFDVIQDGGDPNRIWVYEVYKDEAAFQAQVQSPELAKWRAAVEGLRDEGPPGTAGGSHNIWPSDADWK